MCLSFLIYSEKVKNKNCYMPHERACIYRRSKQQSKNKSDLVFCPAWIESCEKNPQTFLYLQCTEMSFKFIRNQFRISQKLGTCLLGKSFRILKAEEQLRMKKKEWLKSQHLVCFMFITRRGNIHNKVESCLSNSRSSVVLFQHMSYALGSQEIKPKAGV